MKAFYFFNMFQNVRASLFLTVGYNRKPNKNIPPLKRDSYGLSLVKTKVNRRVISKYEEYLPLKI